MRILVLISSLFLSMVGNSQEVTFYKNQVKINPLIPFGVINQAVELGYERNFNRFSTELRASWALPISVWDQNTFVPQNARGFRVTAQEKYYYSNDELSSNYFGVSVDYINRSHDRQLNFDPYTEIDSLYGQFSYGDTVRVHRKIYSVNLTTGTQINFNRFYVELQIGIGIRLHDVAHTERIDPDDFLASPRHPSVAYMTSIEGQRIGLSLPMAVRIGYRF